MDSDQSDDLIMTLDTVKKNQPAHVHKIRSDGRAGEEAAEIYQVMDDLRTAKVDFLTIGQYLQPTPRHHPVLRYVASNEFQEYEKMAPGQRFFDGFGLPLTRSSYHAGDDFRRLRAAREKLAC